MVVSFDFDGVLHSDMWPGTCDPINFWTADLEPRHEWIEVMRQEAEDYPIVIVTARAPSMEDVIWQFVEEHDLPVERVFCTDNQPKSAILLAIGAIRHYDDAPSVWADLERAGIEVIRVEHPPR